MLRDAICDGERTLDRDGEVLISFTCSSVKRTGLPTIKKMLLAYKDCIEKYGSLYQINKAIRDGRLHRIEPRVYSDTGEENELEIVQWKHPNAVMTLDSAYFYYGLTDVIPSEYHMATAFRARRIDDPIVRQYYMPDGTFSIGKTSLQYCGDCVRIYDLERLLIETARMKSKLPYDLYKEVISSFRNRIGEILPAKIQLYLRSFPKRETIENIIGEEVF